MMDSETLEPSQPAAVIGKASLVPARTSRTRIIIEFALIGIIHAANVFVHLKTPLSWGRVELSFVNLYSQPPGLAGLTAIFLWINGGIGTLNFSWPVNWRRYLWQLLLILGFFWACSEIFAQITHRVWGVSPQAIEMKNTFKHPQLKHFFLFVIFPVWAFAEELFYRAYLIQRIEQLTSPWRHSTLLATCVSLSMFALAHLQYGVGELPYYLFVGLLFSGIYLYTRRSIWFVTLIHYLSNAARLAFA